MATNPLYNTNDSPSNQTTPTKSVNNQGVYVPRTHNTYDMSYFNFRTQRFGQYEPFFVMEGVPGDRIPFSNSHNVRSLPFATPFLSSLKLNKDYFLVPNQAIQPNTWEYIFKNPSQGDDVPQDAYNVFNFFVSPQSNILHRILDHINQDFDNGEYTVDTVYAFLIGELFFSSGSLLHSLNFRINPKIKFYDDNSDRFIVKSFDQLFDEFFSNDYINFFGTVSVDGVTFRFSTAPNHDNRIPKSAFLDLLRFFGSSVEFSVEQNESSLFSTFQYSNLPIYSSKASSFNMDRLCAYQLSCAQYFVNPQVDFLYNAQLYRDNFLGSLINATGDVPEFFSYNGISVLYDSFSSHYYQKLNTYFNSGNWATSFDLYSLLFGYKETLKFGDYFTDSRTRPLAVGDTNIFIDGSEVSVVDVSKKIVLQRFLNNVIKLRNTFGDYLRGIFGTTPSPDYHYPKFIIHQDFDISGFETANTASIEDQGKLTTNLMSGEDTYVFEIDVDMPCILIGISHFSVPILYSQTKDRQFFHKDRFDFFNPMLQYTGDQPVYLAERSDLDAPVDIVGYQSRYNEYKQRVSVASGGFIQKLPAWAFVTDDLFNEFKDPQVTLIQSPVSIRHFPFEFNRFFNAMSGLSLSSAFHFIIVYNNKCMCNRPMEVNPSIL